MAAPEIYSLNTSPAFNTVLLIIVTMLYIRSLELTIPTQPQSCTFNLYSLQLPTPGNPSTLCYHAFDLLDSTYDCDW